MRERPPSVIVMIAVISILASVWTSENQAHDKSDKTRLFIDTIKRARSHNRTIPTYKKNGATIRVVTYNVHFWSDPYECANFENIIQVLQKLNADILILQEVSYGPTRFNNHLPAKQLAKRFRALGYTYQKFCTASMLHGVPFGNMIASKYPAQFTSKFFEVSSPHAGRCFIHAIIDVPTGEKLSLYGTHLEAWDDSESIRTQEIQELIDITDKDTHKNILIAADFNAVRKKDYAYTINGKNAWDLIQYDDRMRGIMATPTTALALLEKSGFVDSFSKSSFPGPHCTVWSGRVIDFIFLKNSWNLALRGSYVYYDAASDHLPIILDIDLAKAKSARTH